MSDGFVGFDGFAHSEFIKYIFCIALQSVRVLEAALVCPLWLQGGRGLQAPGHSKKSAGSSKRQQRGMGLGLVLAGPGGV